ncbi:MAG: hypothetical protein CL542_08725 [Alcanivorax sp.]|nr:hypothetical protein [Alcanivorax sp.]|tara:strand:+ start:2103 stop:2663 length:561 start_codon:yes stop_codon:yes gene_type:complete
MFIRCFKYNRALLPDNFFAARKICRRAALRDHGGMVSNLENIDTFHTCVSVVLNRLYENFPNPIDIDVFYIEDKNLSSRVLYNYDDEMGCWDEEGNSSSDNPIKDDIYIYKNSIYFLIDEEYLRADKPEHGQNQRTFSSCVLTSKGLAVLGKVGVKQKFNWGEVLHSAIRDGKYKTIRNVAENILS